MYYPTIEKIIEYNVIILNVINVKKKDKPEVLSKVKILNIINECKNLEGDVYDKAVFLLRELIQKHPFASGNRRTAFVVTKDFIIKNKEKFKIKEDPKQARIMVGIREGYYKDEEIKEWIKHGKIKKFER
ncbi:MAG: type II toxin-antitoxin system death-on-curing family toxin [Nanoarchaeota archaeon]|nr:type II toxin-antitoxin system death-on-curing family toxin [Nanoarchaeota archaeon]